jgi:hypothetical protein
MGLSLVLSAAAGLLTATAAALWAGLVADGMDALPELDAERPGDIRTW